MGGGGGGMMGGYRGGMGPMGGAPRGGMAPTRGGGAMGGAGRGVLTLAEVQGWLEKQQPFVLQTVMKTCTNLLVSKHDVPAEDLTDWYRWAGRGGAGRGPWDHKVASSMQTNSNLMDKL